MYTDFTCLKSRTKSQLLIRLVTSNGKLSTDTDEDSWKHDKSIWNVLRVSLQRTAKLGLSNTEDRHRIQLVGSSLSARNCDVLDNHGQYPFSIFRL